MPISGAKFSFATASKLRAEWILAAPTSAEIWRPIRQTENLLALEANRAKIQGSIFFRNGLKAQGGVDLTFATIGGTLSCDGGRERDDRPAPEFISTGKAPALNANGATIEKAVFLRNGFKAEGGADLSGADIGGNLSCNGGEFFGTEKRLALKANRAKIQGSIFLCNGFKAKGGVDLAFATIGESLECDGGRDDRPAPEFISTGKIPALNAANVKVGGNVFLREGTIAKGEVRFMGAHVDHSFEWRGISSPEESVLDLRFSKVGILRNDQNSQPMRGNLRVDGLVYDQIDDEAPPNAKAQLGWLECQPQNRFLPQPYEQLATVLRKMGLEEDSREVMIAKNKNHATHRHWHSAWLWYGLFGKLIGYGYRPWSAFKISLIVIGIG
jgi:sRNA-binding regulator protein Hfq